jgi:hypothetical protein
MSHPGNKFGKSLKEENFATRKIEKKKGKNTE